MRTLSICLVLLLVVGLVLANKSGKRGGRREGAEINPERERRVAKAACITEEKCPKKGSKKTLFESETVDCKRGYKKCKKSKDLDCLATALEEGGCSQGLIDTFQTCRSCVEAKLAADEE